MKYKNYTEKITRALKEYKEKIDIQEAMYVQEKKTIQAKAEEMKGQWTDEYIEKYLVENDPYGKYKKQMQDTRAIYEPTILHYLELIKKQLDGYFNAPVKTDFANKISAIKLSGLQLSDTEFQILQQGATSYMERRLLNQLAESRTKTGTKTVFNKQTGEAEYQTVQTADPYIQMKLPNIDVTYGAYKEYKSAAKGLLYDYAGYNANLADMLENGTPNYVAINMDSYFRNEQERRFAKAMDEANAILPESKIKRELTENDKRLIDTLIDPKYPSLAKPKVQEIAKNSPELSELFLLDNRYAKYLDTEE